MMQIGISQSPLDAALAAARAVVPTPEGYALASARRGALDGADALVFRYERADGVNAGLGGEHFSLVVDARTHAVKGFTFMDARFAARAALPSDDAARVIATDQLERVAPGLASHLDLMWIEPHPETLRVARGADARDVTVLGTKVKFRQTNNGKYAWVIVAADGTPITLERDVVWDTRMSRRATEKWLHDAWLAARAAGERGAT